MISRMKACDEQRADVKVLFRDGKYFENLDDLKLWRVLKRRYGRKLKLEITLLFLEEAVYAWSAESPLS